ncbi:hypothetical protein [Paenibacillus amylolyticus]|uniref:Collagen triple helix repeat-containing protein n=1 Tax=Paenibacillus amylolyticus TaxID=1451 RepID=A0A117I031_PAEAM|nr:hypothetical protein [Paenibacillus amylolyticus]GAS79969.1 collagen triple helix repeat-containing protein [Paenibacillus amylolyticus]
MAILSTGPIENNISGITGIRPTQSVTVKIDNRNETEMFTVLLRGYYLNGVRTLYVEELLNVSPNQVITKDYDGNFDAFEFVFSTSDTATEEAQISVWGKGTDDELVAAHRLVSQELLGETQSTTGKGLSSYAYIFNTSAQTVATEADITFDSNQNLTNIIHTPNTAEIIIGNAGDYAVFFIVAGVQANQFTLYQNGAPVGGSVYGSGAGTQPNPGMVIITAASSDVLTLRNHSSASEVDLQTLAGGTQINANASILIQQLSG